MMYNNYYINKTALITGGGSGTGRGLCEGLAERGAIVTCTDINLNLDILHLPTMVNFKI